eukprot:2733164-Rhodomonas_salina.1
MGKDHYWGGTSLGVSVAAADTAADATRGVRPAHPAHPETRKQENAFLVQSVRRLCFAVFDFAVEHARWSVPYALCQWSTR